MSEDQSVWRRLGILLYVGATLGMIIWAASAMVRAPCRSQGTVLAGELISCPSRLTDAAMLAVSVVLWLVASVSLLSGSPNPPLVFYLLSGVLSTAVVSLTGDDLGMRLYAAMLAWVPLSLYMAQVRLLGRPSGVHITITIAVLAALGILLTVPILAAQRGTLASQPWFSLWDLAARLELIVGVSAAVALLIWASRGKAPAATRRPIRLATFGIVSALLPVMLLSSLPDMIGLGVRIPYSISLMGVFVLPVMYAHALVSGPDGRSAAVLRRAIVYYLMFIAIACGFLIGIAILERVLGLEAAEYPLGVVLIGIGLVLAMDPLRAALERLTHWIWFGRASPYVEVVGQLAESLSVAMDRRTFVDLLVRETMRIYSLSAVGVYLRDADDCLSLEAQVGMIGLMHTPPIALSGGLAATLLARREPMFQDSLCQACSGARPRLTPEEQVMLERAGIVLWVPLASAGRLNGLLLVGHKVDEDWYSAEDLRTLSTIARQAGVAAHNVLLIDELHESRRAVEAAHQQLLAAREQEQRRLAQELHDGSVQQILSVRYRLAEAAELLEQAAAQCEPESGVVPSVAATLGTLREELSAVVEQLREHIGALRPSGLDDLGLAAALVGLGERLQREHGTQMPHLVLDLDQRDLGLPPDHEINLYRVAQESLRNAIAHSGATEIVLRLRRDMQAVTLTVQDNGAGFRVPARLSELAGNDHFGLVSMYERMSMMSGTLELRSAPGAGTEVVARLEHPWEVPHG